MKQRLMLNVEYKMTETLTTSSRHYEEDVLSVMALAKKTLRIKKRNAFKMYQDVLASQVATYEEWLAVMACVTIADLVAFVENDMSEATDMNLKSHLSWFDEFLR